MSTQITVSASCVAAFAAELASLPHETRAIVRAIDSEGHEWAAVDIAPMTDSARTVFPVDSTGVRGDTRKRTSQGVMVKGSSVPHVVIERARRMYGI